jgi:DNA invertase Pin-like site-specific DNA recombinase
MQFWCTATTVRSSLRQLVNTRCEFRSLGAHLVSLHEGVDTSTPNGRIVFGIFAMQFDNFESHCYSFLTFYSLARFP